MGTYQFNIGSNSPYSGVTSPNQALDAINQQIEQLSNLRAQYSAISQPVKKEDDLWCAIDEEVASLTYEQKELLNKDETYVTINAKLQELINAELVNSVKYKVMNSKTGRELLEKQLLNIKDKKDSIIRQSNEDIELFKRFKEAVQSNPNLTYAEFIKSLN